jgi:protoporphyrinogen/coproporphyrinogen III oxidase
VPRVVIVGGGISGLATAYHLAKAGIPSTLIDRRPRLGGVIQSEVVEGCLVESGPDSFPSAKPWALELIRDVGLGGEVIGSNDHQRVTYVKRNGGFVPLPDGLMLMVPTKILPLVGTRLLGWGAKVRMGLECLRRPPTTVPKDRSVAEFIRDHYGQEAVDYLAEPLLSGIYGGDPEELSVSMVLAMFTELERKYGSLTRGVLSARRSMKAQAGPKAPLFQTLKGGLGALTSALAQATARHLTVVHAEANVIERMGGQFLVRLPDGTIEADAVVLACQAYEAGDLVRTLDPEMTGLLASVGYNSSITVALGFQREGFASTHGGFGFLIPKRERRLMMAGTWVGTKFPYRVPEDKILLRCFISGSRPEDDATLIRAIREELRESLGVRAEPLFTRVTRWSRAMAQYLVGHQQRMKAVEERRKAIPGLHLVGNAYTGIGVSDCARMGRQAAEAIISSGRARG